MPAQTLDALRRSLKRGEFASAYYLHGPEDLLKDEVTRALLDRALDPASRDFNFDQGSAATLDPEAVYALCNTPPMMAERRVVLIRDVEAWKRRTRARGVLLSCLDRPSPDAVVVLVQGSAEEAEDKELAARAVSVACEPLPPDRAAKWLVHRGASLGVEFAPGAAEHLVRVVGTELGLLAAELEKLAATTGTEPVGQDRVGALVGVRHGETIYDWRDAVLEGNAGRAATLVGAVLQQSGVTGVRLVTLLGTTLVAMGVVRAAYDGNVRGARLQDTAFQLQRRARVYGLLSWQEEARRWAAWAPQWPLPRVRTAVRLLVEADTALKSTTVSDERGILLDLAFRL
ncbi:MAG TPA: DNA polymerase III subunit delta [Gemmatimonadales bacterium]|nr:DNA polymerase III subunit delta [Gemmatimonadales bacterium]